MTKESLIKLLQQKIAEKKISNLKWNGSHWLATEELFDLIRHYPISTEMCAYEVNERIVERVAQTIADELGGSNHRSYTRVARAAITAMEARGIQSEESPDRVETSSQARFNSEAPAKIIADRRTMPDIASMKLSAAATGKIEFKKGDASTRKDEVSSAPRHSAQVTDGTSSTNIGFGKRYSKEPTINIESAASENPTVPTHISSAAPKDLSAQSVVGSCEISVTAIKIMDEIKRNIWRDTKGIAFYVPSEIITQIIDCAMPYLNKVEPNPHREFCVKCQELLGWKTEPVMRTLEYYAVIFHNEYFDTAWYNENAASKACMLKSTKAVLEAAGVKYVD